MPKRGRTGDHADPDAAGAHRDYVTVIGNLSRAGGKNATDHAVSSAGWLSGVVAKQTEAQDISLGITIDQVLKGSRSAGLAVPVDRVRHRGFLRLHRRVCPATAAPT